MTLNLSRKLLLIGVPVVLAGAGLTTMAANAATPTPTATPSQQVEIQGSEAADSAAAELDDNAAEPAAEANEPALPGGGHADSATDANADHQFDGVE
jgi:hypothetical protein